MLTDSLLEEDLEDLGALVSLELDDGAHLLIVDERAVARELLCKHPTERVVSLPSARVIWLMRRGVLTLESLQELLLVILLGDSLEGGDRLAAVALLNADVNVVG